MQSFLQSPFFGITLSLVSYLIGVYLFKISKKFFLFTPLFVSMVLGVLFLYFTKISYTDYKKGGDIIIFFLNPATIAFAIPLYKRAVILKRFFVQIFISIAIGSFLSIIVVYIISLLFKMGMPIMKSVIPQAATTAIALPIATGIGGLAPVTGYSVILNAVIVYALGSFCLEFFKIKNPVARGIAMGTSGHALGVARSIELGAIEAAMSSIAVVVVGVITVFIVPLFLKVMGIPF
jgi:holin-like protein LrgB